MNEQSEREAIVAWRYMLANGVHIVDTYRRTHFNGERVFYETPLYAHLPQPDASALVEAAKAFLNADEIASNWPTDDVSKDWESALRAREGAECELRAANAAFSLSP